MPEREDKPKSNAIKDLCFSPDGSKLVVAVENRVLVYDGADGELLHSLRGHKDTVREMFKRWWRMAPLVLACVVWVSNTRAPLLIADSLTR